MQIVIVLKTIILVFHICVGDEISGTVWPGTSAFTFRLEVFGAFLGTREGSLVQVLLPNAPGKRNTITSHDWPRITTSSVFNKHKGNVFLQVIQVFFPQFWLFDSFTLNNVNAGGSAFSIHKNVLQDAAIFTHVTTCLGRDHIVTTWWSSTSISNLTLH